MAAVSGRGRIEHALLHLTAIDRQLVIPQTREVNARAPNLGGNVERMSQQWRGDFLARGDPLALPVLRGKQPHLEVGRFAPGARSALLVPHTCLPVRALAA